jgi:putative ABC transport system permease protein
MTTARRARQSDSAWNSRRAALPGLVAGALASAVAMRVTASLVFGVETLDALTYSAAIALVLAVSTAAGLVPALRAARLDPMQALRQE